MDCIDINMEHFKENSIVIREMEVGDLEEVFWIERDSFSLPWSKEALKKEIENKNSLCLVADTDNTVSGFIMAKAVLDEAEILEFAVKKDLRKKGIGTSLLAALLAGLKQRGVKTVYLEVRASNIIAINLYKKAKFIKYGIRKDYYMEPREDAILMKLFIKEF